MGEPGVVRLFPLVLAALVATAPPAASATTDLLGALGCPACHTDLPSETDVRSKAPALDDAGERYRPAYLYDYLRAPRRVRRHLGATRMPDFGLSEAEAVALTLYLSEQTRGPVLPPDLPAELDEPVRAEARIGSEAEFLEEIGTRQDCLACHARGDRGGILGPELGDAGVRLHAAWIRRFLAVPSAWGIEDGVMPPLFLRAEAGRLQPVDPESLLQLRRIADHLDRSGAAERERLEDAYAVARARAPDVTADDGRRIADALGCRACHALGDDATPLEAAPELVGEEHRVRRSWLAAYLSHPWAVRPFGTRPGNGARMPDFRLSPEEVDRLLAELDVRDDEPAESTPLTAYQRSKAALLLREKLPCLGCHRLGDSGGRVGPDLTNASSRLRPSFVRAIIVDPAVAAPHATMPKLPLDEATIDLVTRLLTEPRTPEASEYLSLVEYETIPLPPAPGPARDYARYCAPCHGARGDGQGFNASFLPTPPTAHADASRLRLRADDTIYDGIAAGGAILNRSHLMPAWRATLDADRIEGLVSYIRELCDCAGPTWSTNRGEPEPRVLAPHAPPEPPELLSAHATVAFGDFVGAPACAECHPDAFETWAASTHGHAGGVPPDAEVIAAFDGRLRRFRDGTMRPLATGDGRYLFRVEPTGSEPVELRVDAVVGGGHMVGGGTQAFFTKADDGSFRMLPFDYHGSRDTWFVQRRGGAWTPIGPHVGLDELAHWPPVRALGSARRLPHCENCHGSQIEVLYDEDDGTYETRWSTLQIDCESCHGPGRSHVAWARAADRDANADIGLDPLVALGKEESLQVCLRCHANKQMLTTEWLAGQDPRAHLAFKLPMLAQGAYLVDGRIDGFGYQQNHLFSDCFVEGSMVCTDCHDPHAQTYRDVDGRPLEGRFDDGQCTGCHASKARDVAAHTHHPAESPGSRCVACHMPYLQHQAVGDELPFARSDHTIPIPRPAFDESIGIENACATCHADLTTTALQARVDDWWGPVKPHHPMIERVIRGGAESDPREAAELLLAPGEPHTIAQMAGLSAFVRNHVRTDTELPGPAVDRLVALADAPDLDVAAVALAALHIGAPDDPRVTERIATIRGGADPRRRGVLLRWRYALVDLSRLRAARGEPTEARRLRRKIRATRLPGD